MKTLLELRAACAEHGVSIDNLWTDGNPKVAKSEEKIFILHLKPGSSVCFNIGLCESVCLDKAGNPAYKSAKERARTARTELFLRNRQLFLYAAAVMAAKLAKRYPGCAFRFNGTSDIPIERDKYRFKLTEKNIGLFQRYQPAINEGRYTLIESLPENMLYDYTKIIHRLRAHRIGNYHLTYSLDGPRNVAHALEALDRGYNVAVPFFSVPETLTINGRVFEVIDGDSSDYRPGDHKSGVIVGLKYKRVTNGEAFKNNGFILESDRIESNLISIAA